MLTHPRLVLLSLGGAAAAAPPFTAVQLLEAAGALMAGVTVAEHTGRAAAELGAPPTLPQSTGRGSTGHRQLLVVSWCAPCRSSLCTTLTSWMERRRRGRM